MKKVLIFLLMLNFSFCFSQIDWYKTKIKSDSARFFFNKYLTSKTDVERLYYLDESLNFEPDNILLNSVKAIRYYYVEKDFIVYENFIQTQIKKFPNEDVFYFWLGFSQEGRGELQGAILNYNNALMLLNKEKENLEDPSKSFSKMLIFLLLDKKNEAKNFVNQYPPGKSKDFLLFYYGGYSDLERNKLHNFLKNEFK